MSVIGVERALILLRYIADSEEGLSIREASREFGYNPATVQKIINALNSQGFVVQDQRTGRYYLGSEAVQLGLTALSRLDIRRVARPYLESLSFESGETAFLAIVRGNHGAYVDKVVSDQPVRMDAELGAERPLNCTAVGKILLAGMSDEEIKRVFDEGAFEEKTENSILSVPEMLEEVEKVREQGWAQDLEEYAHGAICIAAPVYGHEGQIVAALTASGLATRMKQDLERIIQLVVSQADGISREMGITADKLPVGNKISESV